MHYRIGIIGKRSHISSTLMIRSKYLHRLVFQNLNLVDCGVFDVFLNDAMFCIAVVVNELEFGIFQTTVMFGYIADILGQERKEGNLYSDL